MIGFGILAAVVAMLWDHTRPLPPGGLVTFDEGTYNQNGKTGTLPSSAEVDAMNAVTPSSVASWGAGHPNTF